MQAEQVRRRSRTRWGALVVAGGGVLALVGWLILSRPQCASRDGAAVGGSPDYAYWTDIDRVLATTPHGRTVAVVAHNCYAHKADDAPKNLADTLKKIHAALDAGADVIELDVYGHEGTLRVAHDQNRAKFGPQLAEVLADARFGGSDQPLFLELKHRKPTEEFLAQVLDALMGTPYARQGRPVVIRSVVHKGRDRNLLIAQKLLAREAYAQLRPFVRVHSVIGKYRPPELNDELIRKAKRFDGVEVSWRNVDLHAQARLAHELGLVVAVHTIPNKSGKAQIATLREHVDFLTMDFPPARGRAALAENNLALSSSGTAYDLGEQPRIDLGRADTSDYPGVLLTIALSLGDTRASEAGQAPIVSASGSDGLVYGLELSKSPAKSDESEILRFFVNVDGNRFEATYPATKLSVHSHFVTGAWDGQGPVRLWVDNHEGDGVPSKPVQGALPGTPVEVVLGADAGAFGGIIHSFEVLGWGDEGA